MTQKLSLKDGLTVWFSDMPESVRAEIGALDLIELTAKSSGLDSAHIFVRECKMMEAHLRDLRALIVPTGFVWVSWPKKSSKVPTDITEDTIRAIAIPMGWVDVKVCAVDNIWSGLKLVIRRQLR